MTGVSVYNDTYQLFVAKYDGHHFLNWNISPFTILKEWYLNMENAALLVAIIENAIDGIITINDRGVIESINPAACKLFEYTPGEVIGKNVSMLMPPPDKVQHDEYLQRYQQTGHAHIIGIGRDVVGLKKDGTKFPFRLGISEVQFLGRKI